MVIPRGLGAEQSCAFVRCSTEVGVGSFFSRLTHIFFAGISPTGPLPRRLHKEKMEYRTEYYANGPLSWLKCG